MRVARNAPTSVPASGFSERRKTMTGRKVNAPLIKVESVNKQIFKGMADNRELMDNIKRAKEMKKI